MHSQRRIVHVFENTIFNNDFIQMSMKEFPLEGDQRYVVWKGSSLSLNPLIESPQVISSERDGWRFFFRMLIWLWQADLVVVHSLFSRLTLIPALKPFLGFRLIWIMWGGDLHLPPNPSWKKKLFFRLRHRLYKNIDLVGNLAPRDHEVFVELTGRKNLPALCAGYINPISLEKIEEARHRLLPEDGITRILIGNSSTASNHHVTVFESLAHLAADNVRFIVPLGYGDMKYREQVLQEGRRLLGNSFEPILDEIPIDDYIDRLMRVNVAIFYIPRQQALSNIYGLLAMRCKVYLHPQSGMIESLHASRGLHLWNYDEFLQGPRTLAALTQAHPKVIHLNKILVRTAFDRTKLIKLWTHILQS